MDQPTAQEALTRLTPLVGEWVLEASPPGGPPWSGEARATIEGHDSGTHLVERSTVDWPGAPDSISIMGCNAANGTYIRLYSDERGICRIYQMSIGDGQWTLWREGEPFAQRFTATISQDGNTITGRWEKTPDGHTWETDFDLVYRKVWRKGGVSGGGGVRAADDGCFVVEALGFEVGFGGDVVAPFPEADLMQAACLAGGDVGLGIGFSDVAEPPDRHP